MYMYKLFMPISLKLISIDLILSFPLSSRIIILFKSFSDFEDAGLPLRMVESPGQFFFTKSAIKVVVILAHWVKYDMQL